MTIVAKKYSLTWISKSEERGVLTGWAMLAADANGNEIVDAQGDVISPDELEKAAQDSLGRGIGADADHQRFGLGRVVESWVWTAEKAKALGWTGPLGWLVSIQVDDEDLRAQLRSGERAELSIVGTAEVSDA